MKINKKEFRWMRLAAVITVFITGYLVLIYHFLNLKICMGSWKIFSVLSAVYLALSGLLCARTFLRCQFQASWFWKILCLFCTPAACIVIEESGWNPDFLEMGVLHFILNYIIFASLFLVIYCILNRSVIAYFLVCFFSCIYGLVNYYVGTFRGYPPLFGDLSAAGTAVTVAGQYSYWLNHACVFSILICMLCVTVFTYFPPDKIWYGKENYIWSLAVGSTAAVLSMCFIKTDIQGIFSAGIYAFSPEGSFRSNGAPATFLISIKNAIAEKPEGYSPNIAKEKLDFIKKNPGGGETRTAVVKRSLP